MLTQQVYNVLSKIWNEIKSLPSDKKFTKDEIARFLYDSQAYLIIDFELFMGDKNSGVRLYFQDAVRAIQGLLSNQMIREFDSHAPLSKLATYMQELSFRAEHSFALVQDDYDKIISFKIANLTQSIFPNIAEDSSSAARQEFAKVQHQYYCQASVVQQINNMKYIMQIVNIGIEQMEGTKIDDYCRKKEQFFKLFNILNSQDFIAFQWTPIGHKIPEKIEEALYAFCCVLFSNEAKLNTSPIFCKITTYFAILCERFQILGYCTMRAQKPAAKQQEEPAAKQQEGPNAEQLIAQIQKQIDAAEKQIKQIISDPITTDSGQEILKKKRQFRDQLRKQQLQLVDQQHEQILEQNAKLIEATRKKQLLHKNEQAENSENIDKRRKLN